MHGNNDRGGGGSGKGKGKKLIGWVQFVNEQAASRVELDSGVVLTKCDQCREQYGEKSQREGVHIEPPCATCRVELLPENKDAASVYFLCKRQVITAGEGNMPIDINHLAIWAQIEHRGIKEPVRCFDMVLKLFHHYLEKESKERQK